jgi:hypothetical protein
VLEEQRREDHGQDRLDGEGPGYDPPHIRLLERGHEAQRADDGRHANRDQPEGRDADTAAVDPVAEELRGQVAPCEGDARARGQ